MNGGGAFFLSSLDPAKVNVEFKRGNVCVLRFIDKSMSFDRFLKDCAFVFGVPDGVALRAHSDEWSTKKMTPEGFDRLMLSDNNDYLSIRIFYDGHWTDEEKAALDRGDTVYTRTDTQVKSHIQKKAHERRKRKRYKWEVDKKEAKEYWKRVKTIPQKCVCCNDRGEVAEYYKEDQCRWLCRYHAHIQDGQSALIMLNMSKHVYL